MQLITTYKDFELNYLVDKFNALSESVSINESVSVFETVSASKFGKAVLRTSYFNAEEKEFINAFLESNTWDNLVNPFALESWFNQTDLNEGIKDKLKAGVDKLKQVKDNVQSKIASLWGSAEKFVANLVQTLSESVSNLVQTIRSSAKQLAVKAVGAAEGKLEHLDKNAISTEKNWFQEVGEFFVKQVLGTYVNVIKAMYTEGVRESIIPAVELHGELFLNLITEAEGAAIQGDAVTAYLQTLDEKVKQSSAVAKLKQLKELVEKIWGAFKNLTEKGVHKIDDAIAKAANSTLNALAGLIAKMNNAPQPPQSGFHASGAIFNIAAQVLAGEVTGYNTWMVDWKKIVLSGSKHLASALVSSVLPGSGIVKYGYYTIKYALTLEHALHLLHGHAGHGHGDDHGHGHAEEKEQH